ncbi:hypothetical protein [Spirosoma agri]|uniref:Phage portal protein n=1 Tax=Spirosoma agri TaxID=1987381 RepID=A0A6M0IFL8_9BACT|nr:hypothetical protein [Spirosoma agri]NEU67066.1 hypothetical protein [Spirosoma agri]
MDVSKLGTAAFLTSGQPSAAVSFKEGNQDTNSVKGTQKRTVRVGNTSYNYYPWGSNNKLPNEMIDLYRSNGDVMNLVQTRADFLFGSGCGWFKHSMDGKDLVMTPYSDAKTKAFDELNDLEELANGQMTYLVETGNVFMNHSREGSQLILSTRDSLTVRAVMATGAKVDKWLLAPDWSNPKNVVVLPAYNERTKTAPETIYQLKRQQSGQFYYGFAIWWAAQEWIRLANRIPGFHNSGLDTEYNANKICRVAEAYIDKFGGDTDETKDKFRDKFYKQVDEILFNKEGKRRVIFDECAMGVDGKMVPYIEFENIPTTLTGKEYSELYNIAVTAFANASGILSGLAGVSDGKVLGGSGSELRVSAEYQQFYRTPRERQVIQSYWNRVIKRELGLPGDVFFGFKNILLETLDNEKSGSSKKTTSSGTTADPDTKTAKQTGK